MPIITAVYENGVFRPTTPVNLPEGSTVRVEPVKPARTPEYEAHLDRVYDILGRSYETGDPEAAARHNEHQP
jgi:predicted DNA-binding antitoxin AbrB/MazE fold protein